MNEKVYLSIGSNLGDKESNIASSIAMLGSHVENKNINVVGITSGASTPEKMVQKVIKAINPVSVEYIGGPSENIQFKLPKEMVD